MKIAQNLNTMRPAFGIRPCCTSQHISNNAMKITKQNNIANAFKKMAECFKSVNEVGKFEKIVIPIENPISNVAVPKAKIIVEPSSNKKDFRTRVLTFLACSPFDEKATRAIAQATGNNFAIGAVLKDNSTITAFKNFIKDSEKFFFSNFSM